MTKNLGGSATINFYGRRASLAAQDWIYNRYLVPASGKAIFGYYDGLAGNVSTQSAQYGRPIEMTTMYNPGSWKSSNPNELNDTTPLRDRVAAFLQGGTVPRVDLNFNQYLGIKAVKVSEFWYRTAIGDFDADGSFEGKDYKGIDSWLRVVIHQPQRIWVSLWHEFDGQNDGGGASVAPDGYVKQNASSSDPKTWFGRGGATDATLTASDFRAAWHHVVDRARAIVAAEGGYEPAWFFNPAYNPAAVPSYGKPAWGANLTDTGCDPGGYYPGHAYVDWVGSDPYNYASVGTHGSRWDNPADLWNSYGGANWWDLHFKVGGHRLASENNDNKGVYKPAMWGETGTNEYRPSTYNYSGHLVSDGDASNWMLQLRDLVSTGPAAGKLRCVCWFGQDYWNETLPITNNAAASIAVQSSAFLFDPGAGTATFTLSSTTYDITFTTPVDDLIIPGAIITSTTNVNDPWWLTLPAGTVITQGSSSNTATVSTNVTMYRKGPGPMNGADTVLRNIAECAQRWPALAQLGLADVFDSH